MEARYRAQDENGRIYDYQGKPEINVNIWSGNHVCDFKRQGSKNPRWKTACFDLSEGEPVIIDGILCAPGSVKYEPSNTISYRNTPKYSTGGFVPKYDSYRCVDTASNVNITFRAERMTGPIPSPFSSQYKTNRTQEQFDEHLRTTSCTGQERKHSHYFKDVSKLNDIDVYRIIDLWKITDPCDQHALKKLLCPGERGHKDIIQDTQDVIDTMQRKLEMFAENVK